MPPYELRQAILAQEGVWSLTIWETGDRAIVATKILREAMTLSLSEAMKIKRKIPGKAIEGTQAEVTWLARCLEKRGITSCILPENRK